MLWHCIFLHHPTPNHHISSTAPFLFFNSTIKMSQSRKRRKGYIITWFLVIRDIRCPTASHAFKVSANATKVTKFALYKGMPFLLTKTPSLAILPDTKALCSWTKPSLGLLNCTTDQHFCITAKIILSVNHLAKISGAREQFQITLQEWLKQAFKGTTIIYYSYPWTFLYRLITLQKLF